MTPPTPDPDDPGRADPPRHRGGRAARRRLPAARVRTCLVDAESVPWIPFGPAGREIRLKYFKVDPVRGEVLLLMRSPAGATLPAHRSTGHLVVYTLEGRWRYADDPQIAGPGSVVFEPAATRHAPAAVIGGEAVVAFLVVRGDVAFLDGDGRVIATEDWRSAVDRYVAYCERLGVAPRDLTATA